MTTFKMMPLVGTKAAKDAIKNVRGALRADWEGGITQVLDLHETSLESLGEKWFAPVDKGMPGLFGTDGFGKVCLEITRYKGDRNATNPDERGTHYHVALTKTTNVR